MAVGRQPADRWLRGLRRRHLRRHDYVRLALRHIDQSPPHRAESLSASPAPAGVAKQFGPHHDGPHPGRRPTLTVQQVGGRGGCGSTTVAIFNRPAHGITSNQALFTASRTSSWTQAASALAAGGLMTSPTILPGRLHLSAMIFHDDTGLAARPHRAADSAGRHTRLQAPVGGDLGRLTSPSGTATATAISLVVTDLVDQADGGDLGRVDRQGSWGMDGRGKIRSRSFVGQGFGQGSDRTPTGRGGAVGFVEMPCLLHDLATVGEDRTLSAHRTGRPPRRS